MTELSQDQIQNGIDTLMEQNAPCMICSTIPCFSGGVFVPNNSQEYGGIEGKQRVMIYLLCKRCFQLRNKSTFKRRLEDKMKERVFKEQMIVC